MRTTIRMQDHTRWGDQLTWQRSPAQDPKSGDVTGQVVGWLKRHPKVDDVITSPMQSGKTARFQVVQVKAIRDPQDMFFADVLFVGYEESE